MARSQVNWQNDCCYSVTHRHTRTEPTGTAKVVVMTDSHLPPQRHKVGVGYATLPYLLV